MFGTVHRNRGGIFTLADFYKLARSEGLTVGFIESHPAGGGTFYAREPSPEQLEGDDTVLPAAQVADSGYIVGLYNVFGTESGGNPWFLDAQVGFPIGSCLPADVAALEAAINRIID